MLSTHLNRIRLRPFLWIWAFIVIYLLVLRYHLHESLDVFFSQHEAYQLDELFVAVNIIGSLGLAHSLLRVKDMAREIGRRRAAEKDVEWIANHDQLTKLPNRRSLEADVARWEGIGHTTPLAAFSIDLDGFKKINDLLGHPQGDQVLEVVAGKLRDLFPHGKVYRLGGDEFLVIAPDLRSDEVHAVGKRIVSSISAPMEIEGASVDVGASVGIARVPEDATVLSKAIQCSDSAMYAAKKAGRNGVRLFAPFMQQHMRERIQIEAQLKEAMAAENIRPYYRPSVDLKTREIVAYEVAVCWEISPGEFVPPGVFMPVAEDSGLIVELMDGIFRAACTNALSWPSHVALSFTISAVLLGDRTLGDRMMRMLMEVGFPAHRVELKLAETALLKDPEAARTVLDQLTKTGIHIGLDAFGMGYSSLLKLSSNHFDTVKIDESLVDLTEDSVRDDALVGAIIALGNGLGAKISADGIERESQVQRLLDLGCDTGQGRLLGTALPVVEFETRRAS